MRRANAGRAAIAAWVGLLCWQGSVDASSVTGTGPPAPRWVLVYAASGRRERPRYTVADFERLIAVTDSAGRPVDWLCTGAIFLELYASSGRVFTTWIGGVPANGDDWAAYQDSLLMPGGVLDRLDSAVDAVSTAAGPFGHPFSVSVMVPYPEPKADTLRFMESFYRVATADGRVGATRAYIDAFARRFPARGYRHLRLEGFYWLREDVPPVDSGVLASAATAAHARGFRLFWIPYYTALGQANWRAFGVDEAWLQPNFFFSPAVPPARLDSAAARALQSGMGLELEFDGRLYANPAFANRLDPYLAILERSDVLRSRPIAIYEGGGALLRLASLRDPRMREVYCRLVHVLVSPATSCQ